LFENGGKNMNLFSWWVAREISDADRAREEADRRRHEERREAERKFEEQLEAALSGKRRNGCSKGN
jgi:hypothetical protein